MGNVDALLLAMYGKDGKGASHEFVAEFLGARSRVIELTNRGDLTQITRGSKEMQIQEDIKAARKSFVLAFMTQQKKVSVGFDGITVSAYIEKYKKDPRAHNETISMEWYESVFQKCVLWRKKDEGQFDLSVRCSISNMNITRTKTLERKHL